MANEAARPDPLPTRSEPIPSSPAPPGPDVISPPLPTPPHGSQTPPVTDPPPRREGVVSDPDRCPPAPDKP